MQAERLATDQVIEAVYKQVPTSSRTCRDTLSFPGLAKIGYKYFLYPINYLLKQSFRKENTGFGKKDLLPVCDGLKFTFAAY